MMRSICLSFALFFLPLPMGVFAYFEIPSNPESFVNDYAELFSRDEASLIEGEIQDLYRNGNIETGVVTVVSLDGERIESLSRRILAEWNIGAGTDGRGMLLLLSGADNRMHIAVTDELLDTVTRARAGWIMDKVMAPAFQNGEYASGFREAINVVYRGVVIGIFPWEADSVENSEQKRSIVKIISFVVFGALVLFAGLATRSKKEEVALPENNV
ncbi:MAG: TPM domain-containing protein [Candidatus Paceibacterota bacterium]